jgi:hypothetical protein
MTDMFAKISFRLEIAGQLEDAGSTEDTVQPKIPFRLKIAVQHEGTLQPERLKQSSPGQRPGKTVYDV